MTVLTSGRFDPPHPSHFCNFIRIAKKYGDLKVVILNYKERKFPIDYCLQVFDEIFSETNLNIEFVVNTIHFAQITPEELKEFGCELYTGGNLKVLRHIELLGFPIEFIARAFDYTASKYDPPD